MSSNRRSRAPRQPYRPEDEDVVETRAPRRDPRRRTPYSPRQQAAPPPVDDYLDEPPPRQRSTRSGRESARQQPQQPAWRETRQRPLHSEYVEYDDDYIDEEYYDDRVIDTGRAPSRRDSGAQPSRSARGRQREQYAAPDEYADEYDEYDDRFDDGFIDEDDWYEEEAAAGGYRPRQRQARQVPRPSISLPRPTMPQVTLPRPSVPVSVREAALAQDRDSLALIGLLVVSLIGMVVVTMTRIDSLAPGFATHISASGVREDVRTEDALWQLPLMAGALLLMNVILAWFLAAWSTFSARFVLITSIIIQVVIWVALLRLAF